MPLKLIGGFGVGVAGGMHLANGWWLDARDRIAPMLIAVAIGAIVAVWAGSNIFPIVLAVATMLSAIPLLIGAVVGLVVSMARS